MSNNILRNPPFCYFVLFLVISLTPFINKSDSSSDLTIFMISLISSFEIISVVTPDLNIFFVNPNVIKTLLTTGLSTFPLKDNSVLSNDPKSVPKNPPDCPIPIFLIVLF